MATRASQSSWRAWLAGEIQAGFKRYDGQLRPNFGWQRKQSCCFVSVVMIIIIIMAIIIIVIVIVIVIGQ